MDLAWVFLTSFVFSACIGLWYHSKGGNWFAGFACRRRPRGKGAGTNALVLLLNPRMPARANLRSIGIGVKTQVTPVTPKVVRERAAAGRAIGPTPG